jgi:FMN-dependent oxidoreductase (nitrilotriacetate monooxygenase family)
MPAERRLHLNLFILPGGHHEVSWRHPGVDPARVVDIGFYQELARTAEAAKFDSVFFADGPSLHADVRYTSHFRLEPFTWLSAIAAVTTRIGLVGTASTTYLEPYNAARLFASLDHLSRGRAGWNIVTTASPQAAANFGLDAHPVHADRYRRAHEFVEVVGKLWDSWEDDAVAADRAAGVFADPERVHRIDHEGAHFKVAGPLNTPRTPQGRPVYVQAGSSEDGKDFAAAYAEAVFTAQQTGENARGFYRDVKQRARALGRDPERILILPGISPYIGSTETEAKALHEEFAELIQPELSVRHLGKILGVDLTGAALDEPVPPDLLEDTVEQAYGSRRQVILDLIRRERPTLRRLLEELAGARGHKTAVGTPEQIADQIEDWFTTGAADGFNVMPPYFPGGLDVFAAEVVPILQQRGLFRTEYEGTTLREHYGLDRPESRYAAP